MQILFDHIVFGANSFEHDHVFKMQHFSRIRYTNEDTFNQTVCTFEQ